MTRPSHFQAQVPAVRVDPVIARRTVPPDASRIASVTSAVRVRRNETKLVAARESPSCGKNRPGAVRRNPIVRSTTSGALLVAWFPDASITSSAST